MSILMLSTGERSSFPKPIVLADRWRHYQRDGDPVVRDQLILAYSPLVKQVAGRIAARLPSHVALADLISYGFGGLITAVERFEPQRGVSFESYASIRIRGAIFDELRSLDWVPRAVRDEERQIERATTDLTTRLQRLPCDEELAGELSLDAEQLDAALRRTDAAQLIALDRPQLLRGDGSDELTLLSALADPAAPDPAQVSADVELRDRVARAVQQLSGREQTMLGLRYHQGLTHAEIGVVLQVSESRVCQIHGKCIIGLRALLGEPGPVAADWEAPAPAEREALLS